MTEVAQDAYNIIVQELVEYLAEWLHSPNYHPDESSEDDIRWFIKIWVSVTMAEFREIDDIEWNVIVSPYRAILLDVKIYKDGRSDMGRWYTLIN